MKMDMDFWDAMDNDDLSSNPKFSINKNKGVRIERLY